ncbi:MAG: hypothetical protein H6719_06070 [Sandaracinaceae bacterium]|nr:hypothetical protein [Sandaracinaceae bacterium]
MRVRWITGLLLALAGCATPPMDAPPPPTALYFCGQATWTRDVTIVGGPSVGARVSREVETCWSTGTLEDVDAGRLVFDERLPPAVEGDPGSRCELTGAGGAIDAGGQCWFLRADGEERWEVLGGTYERSATTFAMDVQVRVAGTWIGELGYGPGTMSYRSSWPTEGVVVREPGDLDATLEGCEVDGCWAGPLTGESVGPTDCADQLATFDTSSITWPVRAGGRQIDFGRERVEAYPTLTSCEVRASTGDPINGWDYALAMRGDEADVTADWYVRVVEGGAFRDCHLHYTGVATRTACAP